VVLVNSLGLGLQTCTTLQIDGDQEPDDFDYVDAGSFASVVRDAAAKGLYEQRNKKRKRDQKCAKVLEAQLDDIAQKTKACLEEARQKERRRMFVLKIAKAKVMNASTMIVRAAHLEACEKLFLSTRASSMVNKVMDLRSTPSSFVTSCLFQHGRVSKVDFHLLKTMEEIRSPHSLVGTRQLPDTPEVHLHLLLAEPGSSAGAGVLSLFMGICILGSVATLFFQSLVVPDEDDLGPGEKQAFKALESIFTIIFCCEFGLRYSVCDALGMMTKTDFLWRPSNICDMCAIFPFFLELLSDTLNMSGGNSNLEVTRLLRMCRMMRLARVARIARLSRSKKTAMFGPIAAVFTVIWGIYLKNQSMK